MIIAISATNNNINSSDCCSFGRCNYFLIIEQENNRAEFIENPFKRVINGAGVQAAGYLISRNVELVITCKIGMNALRFLNFAGIQIHIIDKKNINEIIKNNLMRLNNENCNCS